MQINTDMLFEAAVQLPENERLALVARLLETMPADALSSAADEAEVIEELDRRFADTEGAIPWSKLRLER